MKVACALAGLACIACIACSAFTGPDRSGTPPAGVFTTDATAYVARRTVPGYGFDLITRYANPTADTIYLARCYPNTPYPIYGIVLTDGSNTEGAAYSPNWGCVGHNQQIAIAPGATRLDTLHLSGPNSADGITHRPFGTLTGRFKVVFEPQRCRGDGQCPISADSFRYSNEFTVLLP